MIGTNILSEITEIETRLRSAEPKASVTAMLRLANVNGSQWQRWKAGTQTPLMSTWGRIKAAADELAPQKEFAA